MSSYINYIEVLFEEFCRLPNGPYTLQFLTGKAVCKQLLLLSARVSISIINIIA